MMKGKTKSGFVYEVDDDILDDWDLLEEMGKGNAYGEITATKMILNEAQYEKLKDHCRGENGKVSFKKMDTEIGEIITAVGSKNS